MDITAILGHPFTWGFLLGLLLVVIALLNNWRLRKEVNRLKRFLGEKLEVEADAMASSKRELEALKTQNENLRIKVQELSNQPRAATARELEVHMRAIEAMTVSAPGFAPAWVMAKDKASNELAAEEKGQREAKSLLGRLLGSGKRGL